VDEVDGTTAAGIAAGAAFRVNYPESDPRAATLIGARRDFRDGNVPRNVGLTLGLLLILVLPVVGIELLSATRRAAPQAPIA
jgi:hypothetical protein